MNKKHDDIEAFRASQKEKKEALVNEIIDMIFEDVEWDPYIKGLCFEALWTRKQYELKALLYPPEFQ